MARHAPPPSATQGSTVEREIVARGLHKILLREKLTVQEQQAVARHEKQREEQLRWKFYRSIPQKHWREMSGRQTKVLHEQAALYGLPFGAAKIDLPEVVRRLLIRALQSQDASIVPRGDTIDRALETLRSGGKLTIGELLCTGGTLWRIEPAPPRKQNH